MVGSTPDESTSFVGRTSELARLVDAFAGHRIVTLTGPGGVGKSRLALHAVTTGILGPPEAVAWADLSPLQDERLLAATVSDASGLADHTPRMPADALCAWLADKRMLLVLDSCEHLVDACRDLVGDLLTACPGITVLATSRQPIGIPGELRFEVGPLPRDGDALTLFVERARAAVPGIRLDGPGEVEAVAAICRRLDGIPLALELAGAQLREGSVGEVAERLHTALSVLGTEEPVRPARHQSLRTAIGWSHELCAPLERLLWARLSVLRGTFDESAARAVCAGGPLNAEAVAPALAGLVAKSVVSRRGSGFRMLDTVREYGRMWLAELGEEKAAEDRHARAFLNLVRRADDGWLGPGQAGWYRRLAAAHPDVCAALDHLLANDPHAATEMASRVGFFWACCGHLHEARGYLESVLAQYRVPGPTRTRAQWALGCCALLQGEHAKAQLLGERCAAEADRDDDLEGRRSAAYLLGITHLLSGEPAAAEQVADRALATAPDGPFASASVLRCHLVRIFALTGAGKLDRSAREAERLRRGCVARGEYWARNYTYYQLSLIALFQDRPGEAAEYARAMLDGKRRLGDSFGIALGLDLLAAALAAGGENGPAARLAGTGLAFWRAVGHAQRGTPELGPIREECERAARAALGDASYEREFRSGIEEDASMALARVVRGAG
ncbi:NB-ARC domain-containing protein [Streptomyces sp. NPDC002490]|uniref:ATP-binding protein n=1 Tax=Streptomyces sp. NPDC002490 TaxID=3154416 RepID=UPI0033239FFB